MLESKLVDSSAMVVVGGNRSAGPGKLLEPRRIQALLVPMMLLNNKRRQYGALIARSRGTPKIGVENYMESHRKQASRIVQAKNGARKQEDLVKSIWCLMILNKIHLITLIEKR